MLWRQLTRKFPAITETYRQGLESADSETLLSWAERVIEAKSLDEVFDT